MKSSIIIISFLPSHSTSQFAFPPHQESDNIICDSEMTYSSRTLIWQDSEILTEVESLCNKQNGLNTQNVLGLLLKVVPGVGCYQWRKSCPEIRFSPNFKCTGQWTVVGSLRRGNPLFSLSYSYTTMGVTFQYLVINLRQGYERQNFKLHYKFQN